MTRAALTISASMSGDIVAHETLQKRLEEFLKPPKGICIDENTHRRLEQLCSQMAGIYGVVESVLQLALSKDGEARTPYIRTALAISAKATGAIKLFLVEWGVLAEEDSRQTPGKTGGVASEG